jgi:hypothetical protein
MTGQRRGRASDLKGSEGGEGGEASVADIAAAFERQLAQSL